MCAKEEGESERRLGLITNDKKKLEHGLKRCSLKNLEAFHLKKLLAYLWWKSLIRTDSNNDGMKEAVIGHLVQQSGVVEPQGTLIDRKFYLVFHASGRMQN